MVVVARRVERVSIPRSEFWSFGRGWACCASAASRSGFNSSVGILVVRTPVSQGGGGWETPFQFLGRNSGRSDCPQPTTYPGKPCVFQFLGRNSGRSDVDAGWVKANKVRVSIPRSEFWSFGLEVTGFAQVIQLRFQFLGRNSGRSDAAAQQYGPETEVVSIPRSEFWSFGQYTVATTASVRRFQFLGRNSGRSDSLSRARTSSVDMVSIPRSEFWSFGRRATRTASRRTRSFNSSVGILVVRTVTSPKRKPVFHPVSIPRSEFWSFGHAPGALAAT